MGIKELVAAGDKLERMISSIDHAATALSMKAGRNEENNFRALALKLNKLIASGSFHAFTEGTSFSVVNFLKLLFIETVK